MWTSQLSTVLFLATFILYFIDQSLSALKQGNGIQYHRKMKGLRGLIQTPRRAISAGARICTWDIEIPEDFYQVNFYFLWFSVGDKKRHGRKCQNDSLTIYEEFDAKMEPVSEHCGFRRSLRAVARAQRARLVLKVMSTRPLPNFRVVWYATRGCGGTLYGKNKGTLTTPGYPMLVRSHLRCRWIIHAPHNGSKIKVKVVQFEKSQWKDMCKMEKLIIKDEKSKKIGEFCDNTVSNELTVNSSAATIYFRGDGWRGYSFLMQWNVEESEPWTGDCGVANIPTWSKQVYRRRKRRIVGGEEIPNGMWPWLVQVVAVLHEDNYRRTQVKCGGTIVSNQWVITAAHCVNLNKPAQYYKVILSNGYNEVARERSVSMVVPHPGYRGGIHHDLALIKLTEPLDFRTEKVSSICLPGISAEVQFRKEDICWVSGWGKTETRGLLSNELRSAAVNYHGHCILSDNFVCAGASQHSRGACEGDSGGPLACKMPDGKFYLAGVLSHGPRDCGSTDDLYVSSSFYKWWIRRTVDGKSDSKMVNGSNDATQNS